MASGEILKYLFILLLSFVSCTMFSVDVNDNRRVDYYKDICGRSVWNIQEDEGLAENWEFYKDSIVIWVYYYSISYQTNGTHELEEYQVTSSIRYKGPVDRVTTILGYEGIPFCFATYNGEAQVSSYCIPVELTFKDTTVFGGVYMGLDRDEGDSFLYLNNNLFLSLFMSIEGKKYYIKERDGMI